MKSIATLLLLATSAILPVLGQDDEPAILLTEHSFAKKGDWEIRWFTDAKGKFVEVDMIRSYPNNTAFRMVWGPDLSAIDFYSPTEKIVNEGKAKVTWYFNNQGSGGKITSNAVVHPDNNGDLWLRILQRTDEPGVEDSIAESQSVTFESGKTKWQFDLKGAGEAYAAFLELYHEKSAEN